MMLKSLKEFKVWLTGQTHHICGSEWSMGQTLSALGFSFQITIYGKEVVSKFIVREKPDLLQI